ncbi:unnamed protein product [Paramecium octaurelia]|uniref:Uncharacterized protein n=1 Tax=Paramecium octaurelia TaxID=43137 RepID=A0A8S1UAQ4_PAROT|nr:unnamed protein product [Paramecium octaurelia]
MEIKVDLKEQNLRISAQKILPQLVEILKDAISMDVNLITQNKLELSMFIQLQMKGYQNN